MPSAAHTTMIAPVAHLEEERLMQAKSSRSSLFEIMLEQSREAAVEKLVAGDLKRDEVQLPKPREKSAVGSSCKWLGSEHSLVHHVRVALNEPVQHTLEARQKEQRERRKAKRSLAQRDVTPPIKPARVANLFEILADV